MLKKSESEYKRKISKLGVKDVKKMSKSELETLTKHVGILNIRETGRKGKVLKRDLISAITTQEFKKIGTDFTSTMTPDLIQNMLKKWI